MVRSIHTWTGLAALSALLMSGCEKAEVTAPELPSGPSAKKGGGSSLVYQIRDLGDLGSWGNSYARGMNDGTQIVADLWEFGAAVWQNGTMTVLPTDGFVGHCYVTGINNVGVATGSFRASDGRYHVVLWQGGIVTSLGEPGDAYNAG